MATRVQFASAVTPEGQDSITATFPSTPTEGNVLVARFFTRTTETVTMPDGWVAAVDKIYQDTNEPQLIIATKVAGAAEPTAVTFEWDTNRAASLRIEEWTGVDTATPVRASASNSSNGSTNTLATGTTDGTPKTGDVALGAVVHRNIDLTDHQWSGGFIVDERLEGLAGANPGTMVAASLTVPSDGAMSATVDWTGSRPSIAGLVVLAAAAQGTADAGDPQQVDAGATVTLDASASLTAEGDPVEDGDGEWEQIGGTSVTLSSATAVKPTFTAPSPSTQITLTFRYTIDGSSDTTTVQVAAAPTNPKPVITAASLSPNPIVAGQTLTGTAAATISSGSVVAWEWDDAEIPWGDPTAQNPTADTDGLTEGTYLTSVRAQSDEGVWSDPFPLNLQVVSVGEPVGKDLELTVPIESAPGVARTAVVVQVRAVGGGDLAGDDAVLADRFGVLTEEPWIPGGQVNVQVDDEGES